MSANTIRVEGLFHNGDDPEHAGFYCLGHVTPAEFCDGLIRYLLDDVGHDSEEKARAEEFDGLDRDDIEAAVAHRWMEERPGDDPDDPTLLFHRREAPGLVLATCLDIDDLYRAPATDKPLETFEVTMLGENPLEEAA